MNFADFPETLTEAASRKTGMMDEWTPRDTLIRILREIDSGDAPIDRVVVAYSFVNPETKCRDMGYAHSNEQSDPTVTIGMLTKILHWITSLNL